MNSVLKEIQSDSINHYIENNLDDFYIKSSDQPNFISSGDEKIS